MGAPDTQISGSRPARVLLAEEDHVNLSHLQLLLPRVGYEVVVADGGPQALQLLQSEDAPSLAVLDWTMAGLDGIEICRQLRKTKLRRSTYVILLTRWNQQNDRVAGLEAGADDFLYKPVDMSELRLRLQVGAQIILERALRESEERFHGAFECAGIGMALVKLSGQFLQVNRALCGFLCYEASELLATSLHSISHPEDLPTTRGMLEELLRGERPSSEFERRFITKTGDIAWASLTISIVLDTDDLPQCFFVQVQDISERRQAAQKLQAANAETEMFLRSIPSILIGLDGAGHITRWNLAAAKTFGLGEHAVLGRTLDACGIKWRHADMNSELARWLQTETVYRCDGLAFERDGRPRFLGLNVQRMPCASSENAGFILTGADVTERRGLEEQLRQAQKLEAIGQLAAGVAHEINTPTQYIGDNVRFLKDSWHSIAELLHVCQSLGQEANNGAMGKESIAKFDDLFRQSDLEYLLKEVPHAIEQSLEGVQRVAKIVRAMKEFSHPGTVEKSAIDLNQAIETTITVARSEWKYVADATTELDASLPLILCHAGELNQVILNLIINAAHAVAAVVGDGSQAKGSIHITTRRDGAWVEIAVRDSGGGIPNEIRSRIFEPFFTTKPVGKGTGQGLALAHSVVVNRHQGQIWFHSEPGQGTTFFIRLPMEAGKRS